MKNVLITGGAGFIGSRLCEKLSYKGYNVTIFDNLSAQVHGQGESLLFNRIKDKCTLIKGDVRDKKKWKKAIKGQEIIVHLAAETGTAQSMYQQQKYHDVNIKGTSNMFEVLSENKNKVEKIILASSRAVYGEGKYRCREHGEIYPEVRLKSDLRKGIFDFKCNICSGELSHPGSDEKSKIQPISFYGNTKWEQEKIVMLIRDSLNIDTVIFRYQNVYGPGQSLLNPYTGILSIFSTRILNGNDLDIYEDGLQSRDFVYIEDAVDATILGIEKEHANGEIFNVGTGRFTSVKDVAESLKTIYFRDKIKIDISGKYREGDIRKSRADLTKIKNILGYSAKFYDFQVGLSQFGKWVCKTGVPLDKYDDSLQELNDNGLIS